MGKLDGNQGVVHVQDNHDAQPGADSKKAAADPYGVCHNQQNQQSEQDAGGDGVAQGMVQENIVAVVGDPSVGTTDGN